MIKYPAPAVATDRPRYFACIVIARIIFWSAVFVAFSCLVTTVIIQEYLNGGTGNAPSVEGALLAVTFAIVAVPLIARPASHRFCLCLARWPLACLQ